MKIKLFTALTSLLISFLLFAQAQAADPWLEVSGGSWEPKTKDLITLKSHIESYVTTQAKKQGRDLKKWQDYTFQFQCREEKNRKYIFINALCSHVDVQKMKKEIIDVLDGGSCFFNLKYDPKNKTFFDLVINGDA